MEKKLPRISFLPGISMIVAACLISVSIFAQIPKFNSYPQAIPTIFLDFDGHIVKGTPWNENGPIDAQPATL
jgi:hypothetical protein